ncbi:MAG: NAD-dependent epimerase/dehydratase family protein [Pseudomonadales bacterium]|nr:NAD-dependent epimerase/dehydratase family protein [Pseudomonadales bacterium]
MSDKFSTSLTQHPVLVTGATGYVAGWLIHDLLAMGCTVHACVRNPNDKNKTRYLDEIAAQAPGELHYFKSDLLQEGSYNEAMQGCEVVFHTASPFILEVEDAQRDLLDPAVKGTLNILNSVNNTASVKRVVLTSSVAAIYSDNIDCQDKPHQTLTEAHWNTGSSLSYNPYLFSKVEAEKAAWDVAKKQNRWDMVTINPSLVMGPGVNPFATSDSFALLKQFADGTTKFGMPDAGIGLVDVRDVAKAHIQAAIRSEASGRYIVSGVNAKLMCISDYLQPTYGEDYPLPTSIVPKFLAWLFAPLAGTSRKFIKLNVGYAFTADNSKSIKELGLQYQPLSPAINAMFKQMKDNSLFD